MTLADMIAMRDRLTAARYAGVLKVKTGEDEVTYRSDAEMRAALADLETKIASASGTAPIRQIRIASSKGL